MALNEIVNQKSISAPIPEQSNPLQMINLLQILPNEREKLINNIASCDHALQIWVHTHDDEGIKGFPKDAADLTRYLQFRDKMIEFSFTAKLPILALIGSQYRKKNESGETLATYTRYYNSYHRNGNNPTIYYLPTLRDSPTPFITTDPEPINENSEQYILFEIYNWDLFYKMLKELGVNTVIIRGRNLEFETKQIKDINQGERNLLIRNFFVKIEDDGSILVKKPKRCVGGTFKELGKRGMDVRLSSIVHTLIERK